MHRTTKRALLGAAVGTGLILSPALASANTVVPFPGQASVACTPQGTVAFSFGLENFSGINYPVSAIAYADAVPQPPGIPALSIGQPPPGTPNPYLVKLTYPGDGLTHVWKLNLSWADHDKGQPRHNVTIGPVTLTCGTLAQAPPLAIVVTPAPVSFDAPADSPASAPQAPQDATPGLVNTVLPPKRPKAHKAPPKRKVTVRCAEGKVRRVVGFNERLNRKVYACARPRKTPPPVPDVPVTG